MLKAFLVLLILMSSGCATIEIQKEMASEVPDEFSHVHLGMSHAEVSELLQETIVIGLEADPQTGLLRAIQEQRLYSSEKVMIHDQEYQVDAYLMAPDWGQPFDPQNNLFLFAYHNGILVAKGWQQIEALKKDEK